MLGYLLWRIGDFLQQCFLQELIFFKGSSDILPDILWDVDIVFKEIFITFL